VADRVAQESRDIALAAVRYYAGERDRIKDNLLLAVEAARRLGCYWSEIGNVMGITQQSACELYGPKVKYVNLRAANNPRRAEERAARGWKDPSE
jgi:hypothetical protein